MVLRLLSYGLHGKNNKNAIDTSTFWVSRTLVLDPKKNGGKLWS